MRSDFFITKTMLTCTFIVRKLTSILIVVAVAFASCKKEEKIHPYYPHTLKLTNSKVTYNAWVKGEDRTLFLPFQYFFEGEMSGFRGSQSIIFYNDTLFFYDEIPVTYNEEEIRNRGIHYEIHGDSIYMDWWHSINDWQQVHLFRLMGIGNRN